MKMKWRHSLLVKYLAIVILAMLIWPFIFPLAALVYYVPETLNRDQSQEPNPYAHGDRIEEWWHKEAQKLSGATPEVLDQELRTYKEKLPKADFFWVDGASSSRLALPERTDLPKQWSFDDGIAFMKKSYEKDPFTVVAFIGQDPEQGFMVIQIPRALMKSEDPFYSQKYVIVIILAIFLLFLFVSWLFFYKIRRRLVRLEEAMALPEGKDIPHSITIRKMDEIGQLEQAFNRMIEELTTSRQREREEEGLRKQLIANLSHDLRTPLTIIRSHAYTLDKEPLSEQGRASLALIGTKSDDLNRLIDNLLSYTLLSARKYPLTPVKTDMIRLMRTSAAGWYPVLEEEGFEVDVQLPEEPLYWNIDPRWFNRILDNIFQNVLRHAKSGSYVCLRTEVKEGRTALVIQDRGPGMRTPSSGKGAGIGLTIVAMMVKEMRLEWDIVSTPQGTKVYITGTDLNEI
ncbi:HAMP domain-containing sensor histidine kinase [Paenibacillus lutrae]